MIKINFDLKHRKHFSLIQDVVYIKNKNTGLVQLNCTTNQFMLIKINEVLLIVICFFFF